MYRAHVYIAQAAFASYRFAFFPANPSRKTKLTVHAHKPACSYPQAKLNHGADLDFGNGILNKGKAAKREKRPLTQIEIMAAAEREKQAKKAAHKEAKVSLLDSSLSARDKTPHVHM